MRALVCLAAVGLAAAGCARLPMHIAEADVGDAYYQEMSCPQLTTAQTNLRREQGLADQRQSRFVGVLFPSSEYRRNTQRIAEIKGELAAIARVWTMKGCARSGRARVGANPDLPTPDAESDAGVWQTDAAAPYEEESL
jgi:hypothetical protein